MLERLKKPKIYPSQSESWLIIVNFVCMFGLCVVSAVMLLDMRQDAADQTRISSQNLVQVLGRDILRSVELGDLSLTAFVDDMKKHTLFPSTVDNQVLAERSENALGFGPVIIVNSAGAPVAISRGPLPDAVNVKEREFFQYLASHEDDDLQITGPTTSPFDGRPSVILSRRIGNADKSFAGAVFATVHLGTFRDMFAAVGADRAGTVTLYGPAGNIIMRQPYNPHAIGENVAEATSYARMERERNGAFIGPAMNATGIRHFVFCQIGNLPLRISIGVAPAIIFRDWQWKALILSAVVVSLCAVTILLSCLFTRELQQRKNSERATAMANMELKKLATTDALTGLFNRRRFDDALAEQWHDEKSRQPLSLLLLDADYFKGFNDLYGHQKGDEALKAIARAILRATALTPAIACRIGGEEFAVVFPGLDARSAFLLVKQISTMIVDLKIAHGGSPFGFLSVSGGLAECTPASKLDSAGLVALADAALYRAKMAGRHRVDVWSGTFDRPTPRADSAAA